ncbi:hypothetical protein J2T56_003264 [Natronobacillus azotifigens]|nr:hypothetical protein [Natronobacillus azotifigens]
MYQVFTQEKADRSVRAKQANFPQEKLLDEFVVEALPEQARTKLNELKS